MASCRAVLWVASWAAAAFTVVCYPRLRWACFADSKALRAEVGSLIPLIPERRAEVTLILLSDAP